jgi:hypothetical protein
MSLEVDALSFLGIENRVIPREDMKRKAVDLV